MDKKTNFSEEELKDASKILCEFVDNTAKILCEFVDNAQKVVEDYYRKEALRNRMHRTLIKIVGISGGRTVRAIVPGWNPHLPVSFNINLVKQKHRRCALPGAYFIGRVNIGAESADQLRFERLKPAPPISEKYAKYLRSETHVFTGVMLDLYWGRTGQAGYFKADNRPHRLCLDLSRVNDKLTHILAERSKIKGYHGSRMDAGVFVVTEIELMEDST
jgi:hypothetical protein